MSFFQVFRWWSMSEKKPLMARFNAARALMILFVSMALIMITSAVVELNQSRGEVLNLVEKQSRVLLQSLLAASRDALLANEYLYDSYRRRLIQQARLIGGLLPDEGPHGPELDSLVTRAGISQLVVFDAAGRIRFRMRKQATDTLLERLAGNVLAGWGDIWVRGVRNPGSGRIGAYAAAVAHGRGGALAIEMPAADLLKFRKQVGFGSLIRGVAQSPKILYVALQDSMNLMAAAGRLRLMPEDFPFALNDTLAFRGRIVELDSISFFEAMHPFYYHDRLVGVFRMGMPLTEVEAITERLYRRLMVISLILLVFGGIVFSLIFTRRRFERLQERYDVVESYSDLILENTGDAIIVAANGHIHTINKAAGELFGLAAEHFRGGPLKQLLDKIGCTRLEQSPPGIFQMDCTLEGKGRVYLLASKSRVERAETVLDIFVLRDLTRERALQEQIQRKERLSAMGELASGVAHEIRNPLNTIGTIVQQLDKDFEPAEDSAEYHSLARLVYREVRRINDTVRDFLKFARPEPIQPQRFAFTPWLEDILRQHRSMLAEQRIELRADVPGAGEVNWDPGQMRQVMLNLILNAAQAIEGQGWVAIEARADGDEIEIKVRDSGKGMDAATLKKIFNLYYTTKAGGTGIGLAMVQRIVYEHGGVISVESEPGRGTEFTLRLPRNV